MATTLRLTPMRIEELWSLLRREAPGAQRRVDGSHPLDLYADFEPPDRPGLVLFCPRRPPDGPSLQAIAIDRRQRQDGRWSLRVVLEEPQLITVFAELCRDIIDATRTGVDPMQAAAAVLARLEHWRTLMQDRSPGLDRARLRGLIGELVVLDSHVLKRLDPDAAIASWRGPIGAAQDFQLPDGRRLEVKTLDRDTDRVRINGLGQLDGGSDPLHLAVVRVEATGAAAPDAVTVTVLVERLRLRLAAAPAALGDFETLLRFAGWDARVDDSREVVRVVGIDWYDVNELFPRLVAANVPRGVVDASYIVHLPPAVRTP